MPPDPAYLTPPELARRWRVSRSKVLSWIELGEIRACNLATRRGGRPRYRIALADALAFEQRRAVVPQTAPAPRRRRADPAVIEYF